MPLGLHEGPHHPERAKQSVGAGLRQQGWDDGLVGPLLWAYAVSMVSIQGEVSTSVLQAGREEGRGEVSGGLDHWQYFMLKTGSAPPPLTY